MKDRVSAMADVGHSLEIELHRDWILITYDIPRAHDGGPEKKSFVNYRKWGRCVTRTACATCPTTLRPAKSLQPCRARPMSGVAVRRRTLKPKSSPRTTTRKSLKASTNLMCVWTNSKNAGQP